MSRSGTLLRGLFPVPVYLENDTKAAALAEHLFGACRDVGDFVLVHGGSGIGGALYLQGALYHGTGLAGELGHMKMVPGGRPCGCGGHGCLEAYISDQAIRAQLAASGCALPDVEAVAQAAASDPAVRRVVAAAGGMLGVAIANLTNLLNPRRIVLAGTLAELSAYLLPAVRAALAENALVAMGEDVTILVSELGATRSNWAAWALRWRVSCRCPAGWACRAAPDGARTTCHVTLCLFAAWWMRRKSHRL